MAATYTADTPAPINRFRFEIPDTVVGGSEKFSDERLYSWLEEALSFEALVLRLSTTNEAGATAATAEILLNGTEMDLDIVRTLPGPVVDTQTIPLTPKQPKHRLRHAIDAIRKLDIEIKIGIGQGGSVEWIHETADDWRDGISPLGQKVADLALAGDLALTRNGPINILGDSEPDIVAGQGQALLPFYVYDTALASALRGLLAGQGAGGDAAAGQSIFQSRKEGRTSWSRAQGASLSARIDKLEASAAAFGIFSRSA